MLQSSIRYLLKNNQQSLFLFSRATYIRGYWPEPLTQTTLGKFFQDTNYFDEPKQLVNIGLEKKHDAVPKKQITKQRVLDTDSVKSDMDPEKVDEIIQLLSQEFKPPPLDMDDVRLEGKPLIDLALSSGIYRDLLGTYTPDRDHVKFTREQADNMNLLIPHFWLTDQPYARVDYKPKPPNPVLYFEPLVGISARFVHDCNTDSTDIHPETITAHSSFYGNIIPANEALNKPSVTLDGKLLGYSSSETILREKDFDNWSPGSISTANFSADNLDKYYSVLLLNLDHVHQDSSNLHWMAANIRPTSTYSSSNYDELCEYLPVHGIQGFGYSRYVFLILQHSSKLDLGGPFIEGSSLESRKFDTKSFIHNHKSIDLAPVGLSWFQTKWDSSSNRIFHDYLNTKAPVYEHVQTKLEKRPEQAYPGKIPFNIYLDHVREKKNLNKQVLLERLASVDPFDYKDQYVPPEVPPTVFQDDDIPSWLKTTMFKKKNKLSYWRGLRPASALLPLNNNADLDYPLRPLAPASKRPPEYHNQYDGRKKYKPFKSLPHSKPANEHESVYIQGTHEIHLDKVKKMMQDFKTKEAGK